ncbi:MAG: hypothetical protein GXO32_00280 [Crenarchaeota archaeon]|nr:hypothetical protein [Thermoproteota archaeon]
MSELPKGLRKVFDALSQCYGVELSVISHEGLLYEYRGDVSRAESLAAWSPTMMSGGKELSFALVHREGATVLAVRMGEYTVAFEGDEKALSAYLKPVTRIASEREAKCGFCGFELDSAVVTCPRCGASYPFTLHSCPKCGYTTLVRRCPKCGRSIDEDGRRVSVSKLPLATALGAVAGVVLALTSFFLFPSPTLISASFIVPTVLGGVADLATKPRVRVE